MSLWDQMEYSSGHDGRTVKRSNVYVTTLLERLERRAVLEDCLLRLEIPDSLQMRVMEFWAPVGVLQSHDMEVDDVEVEAEGDQEDDEDQPEEERTSSSSSTSGPRSGKSGKRSKT
jgi:hypothetical protein